MQTAFVRDDWIGCGRVYDDLPETVRASCAAELEVPTEFSVLIPSASLPISALITMHLPAICITMASGTKTNNLFICSPAPPLSFDLVSNLTIPPQEILSALLPLLPQAWLDGVSLRHPAASVPLPLWVVKLWMVLLPIATARVAWTEAYQWLAVTQSRALQGDKSLLECVEKLHGLLERTVWNVDLRRIHADAHALLLTQILKVCAHFITFHAPVLIIDRTRH